MTIYILQEQNIDHVNDNHSEIYTTIYRKYEAAHQNMTNSINEIITGLKADAYQPKLTKFDESNIQIDTEDNSYIFNIIEDTLN